MAMGWPKKVDNGFKKNCRDRQHGKKAFISNILPNGNRGGRKDRGLAWIMLIKEVQYIQKIHMERR
jgi:hypothetical protein